LSPKINRTTSLVQFTFSLADVVVDNEEFSLRDNFFVHCLNGSLGVSRLLEANVTVILGFSIRILLNMSGFDGAKLGEEVLQLGVISTVG
jgi:hypothetical protein